MTTPQVKATRTRKKSPSRKKVPATVQNAPTEFPVTLDEFVTELPPQYVGARSAFRLAAQGMTGKRLRSDWRDMFDAFMKAPVGTKITG